MSSTEGDTETASAQVAYETAARELFRLRHDPHARPEQVAQAEEALRSAAAHLRDIHRRATPRAPPLAPLHTRSCSCGTRLGATSAAALDQAWASHARRCPTRLDP